MNRKQRRRAAKSARLEPPARPVAAELRQALANAAQCRQTGRLAEAEALYRRVLRAVPEQPDALHWLGVLAHLRGRHESALALLERAVRARPGEPLVQFHLGEVRRALGRCEAAITSYRRALAGGPDGPDIRFGLGCALLEQGQMAQAAVELRRSLELRPADAAAHNNLANALAALGEAEAAIAHYRRALALDPRYAEAHMNLGLTLAEQKRDEEAAASFGESVAADAGLTRAWLGLIRCLLRLERHEEALAAARRALGHHPRLADVHSALGNCWLKAGRFEAALEAFGRALELRPDHAEAHFGIGVCLQSTGRFEEARAAHGRALDLRPDLAEAHYNLALLEDGPGVADRIAELHGLLDRADLPERERIHVCFALAHLLEAQGDFDDAFVHAGRGNELKARSLAFDPHRHVDFVDRLIATFDEGYFRARSGFGVSDGTPVFVVGMPRSGTSLVEQILASHPAVHGAGELDEVRRMVKVLPERLGTSAPFPDCAGWIDRGMAKSLAEEYLESLRRHAPEAERVTDKMPGNYLRLGLIAVLLPGARVIHCRRDPLDTCLSCYLHNFAHGLSFTYDLGHLGLVYRQYRRLMEHWRVVLPLPVLDVHYEDLIADLEGQTRRMVDVLGLPWDEACLTFHEQPRQVRTASFWQVRQPLYASSVGRWQAYAKHLGPLMEALGDLAARGR